MNRYSESHFQGRKYASPIVVLFIPFGGRRFFGELPVAIICIVIVAIFLFRHIVVQQRRPKRWLQLPVLFHRVLSAVIGCISGTLLGGALAYKVMDQQLPIELEGLTLNITGVVEGIPLRNERRQRFIVRVKTASIGANTASIHDMKEQYQEVERLHGLRIQLSWYERGYHSRAHEHVRAPAVRTGQQWRWQVKLRRPRGFVNPAGFDYHAHLLRQGIAATGHIRYAPASKMLSDQCPLFTSSLAVYIDCARYAIRQRMITYQRLSQWSQDTGALGPLLALMIGDTQGVSAEQWEVLRNTGTVHLFAISGLHIGLAATIGFFLGSVGARFCLLLYGDDSSYHYLPPILSIVCAVLYALLADMSLPTQRAIIMVAVFHLGSIIRCRISRTLRILIALVLIVYVDPLAAHFQGFWLSFLAVMILCYGFSGRSVSVLPIVIRYVISMLHSQWLLAIGLFVASVVWLQGISISAPIANVFAISCVSLIIVPLLFLLLPLLLLPVSVAGDAFLSFLYRLVDMIMGGLLLALESIDQYFPEFYYIPIPAPSWLAMLIALLSVMWLLAPRGFPHRYLGILGFLPLFFPSEKAPLLSVIFFDVGQGTAIAVRTRSKTLVYDVGRSFSSQFNVGEHIVAPYLRAHNIQAVDRVIISHNDADHVGGLQGLLKSVPVKHVMTGQPLALEQKGIESSLCHRGHQWVWDQVTFSILWPQQRGHDINAESGIAKYSRRYQGIHKGRNANSCILLIEFEGRKILLTGDIEKAQEQVILHYDRLLGESASHRRQLSDIDILLVPHHGSKTSSSVQWLTQLRPKWSVVTAGYRNQYGHPHSVVLERYRRLAQVFPQRLSVLNTSQQGAIRFTLEKPLSSVKNTLYTDAKPHDYYWNIEPWRARHGYYWHE